MHVSQVIPLCRYISQVTRKNMYDTDIRIAYLLPTLSLVKFVSANKDQVVERWDDDFC